MKQHIVLFEENFGLLSQTVVWPNSGWFTMMGNLLAQLPTYISQKVS